MTKVTVAALLERIEDLLSRIEALEAEVETLKAAQEPVAIQYVKEVRDQPPLSAPLDFRAMMSTMAFSWSSYSEEDDLGYHRYL